MTMPSVWQPPRINFGRLVAPRGDPRGAPFFEALDAVNALADRAPGFLWRLEDEGNYAMTICYPTDTKCTGHA